MLEELLSIGYDARLPVDEFLAMEFQLHCAVCNILVNDSMVYIGVFRPHAQEFFQRFGPIVHVGQHVVLVDLLVEWQI